MSSPSPAIQKPPGRRHATAHPAGRPSTITAAVLLVLAASAANAQQAAAPTSEPSLGTVVVTGVRSSNAKTIAAKKESAVAVDTIAADEIGKLPDFNVGDALKRVTGVNTLSYQGEPRFVIIRGLNANYNVTQIDGFAFATADIGSRQILMEMLPSNIAQRIDVTKSFLPQSDGAAIGGIVNIVTANAFQLPDNTVDVSAKLGQNLMGDKYGGSKPGGEAAGKWAKRFGDHNEFGLLTTASYWSRSINVPQIESGGTLNWYDRNGKRSSTPYSGNGYAVPTERRWYNYDNKRERLGLTTRLDWRPEGPLSGHLSAYMLKQNEKSNRNDLVAAVNGTAANANQTPTSGTLNSIDQTAQLGRLRWQRMLYGANGELAYEIEPGWTADVRGSVSRSSVSNPQTWDNFVQKGMSFNYDTSGATPVFNAVKPLDAGNLARYPLNYHREDATEYAQTVYDLQANTRRNMESDSRGFGFGLGARFVSTRADTSFSRSTWSGMPYSLAAVSSGTICGFNCNGSGIPVIDPGLADAAFAANAGRVQAAIDTAAQYGGTYGYREDVYAAYAQGQYKTDRFLLAGGLRFEHTSFNTNGFLSTNGAWNPVSAKKDYDKLLPSVVAVYDTTSSSKLRVGLSQTMGRPRFDQMATRGGALASGGSVATLSQGNSDLKPRLSNNVDIGHDWYLDNGRGIVSVAAFYKEIKNEIFNYGQTQQMQVSGVSTPVLVTQARNVDGLVRLSGIELGATKDLTFLPAPFNGLGISANATFTHANYPVTLTDGSTTKLAALPQQPRKIANIALYYDRGPLHAKIAWNYVSKLWDDRFPNYSALGFYANRYQQSTRNVDLQIAYDVSKQLSLTLDILNLTGQGMQYNFGRSQEYVQSAWKLAPSVLVGLTYKL
ncbi:TonB-dependent receptor [Variovorax sp. AFSI2.2]|uniref:TonB-dependent receptor n=1 Tax=Variovorax sp. AFSI2.2 TaxID=3384160 RepID=UPI003EBB3EDE